MKASISLSLHPYHRNLPSVFPQSLTFLIKTTTVKLVNKLQEMGMKKPTGFQENENKEEMAIMLHNCCKWAVAPFKFHSG